MKKRVAAIQMASGPNVGANLIEAGRLIANAVADGAGLVVLPENFAHMGNQETDQVKIRERSGQGQIQDFLAEQAAKHGIWLVGGTLPMEASEPHKVRAACLVYDDRGQAVARYDKIHLFDVKLIDSDESYQESRAIEPGQQVTVVDSPFGRLGLAVCYDLRFPELFRAMVDQGAEVFSLPAAFTAVTGRAHWDILVRARAIENLAYVVAAAQGGFHIKGRETYGHSMIVDPWGTVLARHERGNGIAIATIDPDFQASTRRNFPSLSHRRLRCE